MNLIAPNQLDGPMSTYLEQIHGALHDFNELLPPANTSAKELEQHSTFFMLMALYGLPPNYSGIRDQILGSPAVPTLSTVWSHCFGFLLNNLLSLSLLRPRLILLLLSLRVTAVVGVAMDGLVRSATTGTVWATQLINVGLYMAGPMDYQCCPDCCPCYLKISSSVQTISY